MLSHHNFGCSPDTQSLISHIVGEIQVRHYPIRHDAASCGVPVLSLERLRDSNRSTWTVHRYSRVHWAGMTMCMATEEFKCTLCYVKGGLVSWSCWMLQSCCVCVFNLCVHEYHYICTLYTCRSRVLYYYHIAIVRILYCP